MALSLLAVKMTADFNPGTDHFELSGGRQQGGGAPSEDQPQHTWVSGGDENASMCNMAHKQIQETSRHRRKGVAPRRLVVTAGAEVVSGIGEESEILRQARDTASENSAPVKEAEEDFRGDSHKNELLRTSIAGVSDLERSETKAEEACGEETILIGQEHKRYMSAKQADKRRRLHPIDEEEDDSRRLSPNNQSENTQNVATVVRLDEKNDLLRKHFVGDSQEAPTMSETNKQTTSIRPDIKQKGAEEGRLARALQNFDSAPNTLTPHTAETGSDVPGRRGRASSKDPEAYKDVEGRPSSAESPPTDEGRRRRRSPRSPLRSSPENFSVHFLLDNAPLPEDVRQERRRADVSLVRWQPSEDNEAIVGVDVATAAAAVPSLTVHHTAGGAAPAPRHPEYAPQAVLQDMWGAMERQAQQTAYHGQQMYLSGQRHHHRHPDNISDAYHWHHQEEYHHSASGWQCRQPVQPVQPVQPAQPAQPVQPAQPAWLQDGGLAATSQVEKLLEPYRHVHQGGQSAAPEFLDPRVVGRIQQQSPEAFTPPYQGNHPTQQRPDVERFRQHFGQCSRPPSAVSAASAHIGLQMQRHAPTPDARPSNEHRQQDQQQEQRCSDMAASRMQQFRMQSCGGTERLSEMQLLQTTVQYAQQTTEKQRQRAQRQKQQKPRRSQAVTRAEGAVVRSQGTQGEEAGQAHIGNAGAPATKMPCVERHRGQTEVQSHTNQAGGLQHQSWQHQMYAAPYHSSPAHQQYPLSRAADQSARRLSSEAHQGYHLMQDGNDRHSVQPTVMCDEYFQRVAAATAASRPSNPSQNNPTHRWGCVGYGTGAPLGLGANLPQQERLSNAATMPFQMTAYGQDMGVHWYHQNQSGHGH